MAINIRPARPEDAKLLGWVMLMAGRSHMDIGIWDLIIPQPEAKRMEYLAMLTLEGPRHMCHYKEFLVAEVDGKPAGALEAFDPVTNGDITVAEHMDAVNKKMGLTPEDMKPGEQSIAAFYTCYGECMPGAWVVEHVATRPEYRRMGVISALIDAILDRGRDRGFRLAQVSSYIGNTPAEHAYLNAGFKHHDEKRHPDFEALIGCPGIARYLRDI